MLKRKGRRWELYPHRVKGIRFGEDFDQWALPDKEWWEDTAEMHDHLGIDEFEEVEVTEGMQGRFEEIKNMPDDFHTLYIEYVMTGDISEEVEMPKGHPFNIIRLQNQDKSQGQDITDGKLEAMEQGQKIADIELKLIELGVS